MIKQSINEMIKLIIDTCENWVKTGEDGLLRFVDPIDGEEISAHYGATHVATSLILYGDTISDARLRSIGYDLIHSVIKRWDNSKQLPAFHNDFNNFALCVLWDYLNTNNKDETLSEEIKAIVLSTSDSDNPTVNWFPMRWYVNLLRFQWTGENKYKDECNKCKTNIQLATYSDGFIDDRLPKGLSFNLQYDLATVAVMQFLRSKGEDIDISKELGALINVVSPDGDINYLGRGTNQIFAWGLWIYLLASTGKEVQTKIALNFLKDKLPVMLENNNLMLNEWPGNEKYMWWDYHYCSVYTAHILFWLVLAEMQINKYPVTEMVIEPNDSGIRVYRDSDYFIVTFSGRHEYLSEKGPCISLIWTKSSGIVFKGTFGPWQGAFGNKYASIDSTIRNYCGLYSIVQNLDFTQNRLLHKLLPRLDTAASEKLTPQFVSTLIHITPSTVDVEWETDQDKVYVLAVSCLSDCPFDVYVDDKKVSLLYTSQIKNQYGWAKIIQTKKSYGRKWRLSIRR